MATVKTPQQILFESSVKRKKKEYDLRGKLEKKGKAEFDRLMDNWQKSENRKVKGKIEALERIADGKKPLSKKKKVLSKTEYLKVIQKYVRLRDTTIDGWGNCISCNVSLPWKGKVMKGDAEIFATGGHYINSQWNSTAYDLDNIQIQCNSCNNKMHVGGKSGDTTTMQYRKNLVAIIGESRVKKLESKREEERKNPLAFKKSKEVNWENYYIWEAEVNALEKGKK